MSIHITEKWPDTAHLCKGVGVFYPLCIMCVEEEWHKFCTDVQLRPDTLEKK